MAQPTISARAPPSFGLWRVLESGGPKLKPHLCMPRIFFPPRITGNGFGWLSAAVSSPFRPLLGRRPARPGAQRGTRDSHTAVRAGGARVARRGAGCVLGPRAQRAGAARHSAPVAGGRAPGQPGKRRRAGVASVSKSRRAGNGGWPPGRLSA